MKKRLKIILKILLVIVALVFIGWMILPLTPQYKSVKSKTYDALASMSDGTFRKGLNTVFYDKDGTQIGEVDSGSYEYVEISKIPLALQNAYIAAEDQSFKTHRGVNYLSTMKATAMYILHHGDSTRGGSTITQQVIKNNLLSQERTVTRKILEISIAPELEKKYSKQQIMEFYCNSNYYGNGCYGVQAASRFYFGKDVTDLNTAECAMLAGISNSPNNYNPVASEEKANNKKKIILKLMNECGYLTDEEYKTELDREISVTATEAEVQGINNYMCSYAMYCAINHILKEDGFKLQYLFDSEDEYNAYRKDYKEKYDVISSEILAGGYSIYTSIDSNLQAQAQAAVDDVLSGYKETADGKYIQQGAVVTVDNESGMITSIVGGRGTTDAFNRGFIAKRQPGSTIKPLLVYGPALNEGIINPSSILNDTKIYAVPGDESSFSPKNAYSGYKGEMTAREALARSVNTTAFKLFQDLGIKKGLSYLEAMHFSSIDIADYSSPSLSLGGFTNGVSVADMAKGYATLANEGKYIDRDCITKISTEEKTVYTSEKAKVKEVYSADAAFMITDMMEGVFKEEYGTAYGLDVDGQVLAGKTGTTNSNRDSWLCGYSAYTTIAVWTGNDDNTTLNDTSLTKAIWKRVMQAANQGKDYKDFSIPDTLQYRKIDSNGNYTSEEYDKTGLNMSASSYDRRPDGYEYYSTLVEKKAQAYKEKKEQEAIVAAAKTALDNFESFQLTSTDDARNLKEKYSEAQAAIDPIVDKNVKTEYLRRLNKHYKTLKKAYKETWKARIKEEDEQAEKQKENSAQTEAEDAALQAQKELHDQRIEYVNWYLDKLAERNYNTATTQQLLNDAKSCLANCSSYEEYSSLKKKLDAEESRINGLPTELPKLPEQNAGDKEPDASDYPDDVPETPAPDNSGTNSGDNSSNSSTDQGTEGGTHGTTNSGDNNGSDAAAQNIE